MDVVIEKPGDESATAKVNDFGLLPDCLFHKRASAYPQDPATSDCEGFRDFVLSVNRDDVSIYEHDISRGDGYGHV